MKKAVTMNLLLFKYSPHVLRSPFPKACEVYVSTGFIAPRINECIKIT